jgi:Rrf2 family iron-sulfur cluster assembly transcriptional regulator
MKISTKGRYAVSALIEIALSKNKGPVTLSDLADLQGISLSYAEQLFAGLRNQQLVKGTRGPGGGFMLARLPEEITIAEIIRAVYDNDAENTSAPANTGAQRSATCWQQLDHRIDSFLEKITLADAIGSEHPGSSTRSFGT